MLRICKLLFMVLSLIILVPSLSEAGVKVGEIPPDFTIMDSFEKERSLSEFEGKYIVLEWFNPDCPFVKKHYNSGNMQSLQEKYTNEGVVWLSINSSAHGNQGHYHYDEINQIMQEKNAHSTAILLDAEGKVGRLYGAKTTPHIFIINPEGKLIYQGAIDDIASADSNDIQKANNYVQASLSATFNGEAIKVSSTKSYGCSVKY